MEDPGIKLFGKKILLPESSKSINLPLISTSEAPEKDQVNPRSSPPKAMAESDNPKTPEKSDATNSQPKTLKKPDKILPCPRCSSMDTKFCYYNNYNVNQPRHFCKSCQRYWTAGGAMRNMPVGAGRRKNKNLTYQTEFSVSSVKPVTTSDSEVRVSWPWNSTIPIPAICPPIPFHPSTYWNCIPFLPPPSPSEKTLLGKHSRDDELFINPNDCEDDLKKRKNAVLIPKTLRIDDPDEAAKSSIWATLGIKNDNFKAFQEKGEEKKKPPVNTTSSSSVLQANPAAFSRSLCFQETV